MPYSVKSDLGKPPAGQGAQVQVIIMHLLKIHLVVPLFSVALQIGHINSADLLTFDGSETGGNCSISPILAGGGGTRL
jgi:hypothetical protein